MKSLEHESSLIYLRNSIAEDLIRREGKVVISHVIFAAY